MSGIRVFADGTAAALAAADLVAEALAPPDQALGLPTGRTMVPVYAEMVRRHVEAGLSFAECDLFLLDEFMGLAPDHPRSFHGFLLRHLVEQTDADADRVQVPPSGASDGAMAEACVAFEARIAASGGLDLALLGIGTNGHVAFNEPGSTVDSRTRCVELAADTREREGDVPRKAVTMGIATLRAARRIVLLATGAEKAQAVHDALHGPVDPSCPASLLRNHPDVTFLLDGASARFGDGAGREGTVQVEGGEPGGDVGHVGTQVAERSGR